MRNPSRVFREGLASPTGVEATEKGAKGTPTPAVSEGKRENERPLGSFESADVTRLVTSAANAIEDESYELALTLVNDLRRALVAKIQREPMPRVRRRVSGGSR